MSALEHLPCSLAIPTLSVHTEDGRAFRFLRPFQIGRDHGCEVRIEDGRVSRKHVMVSFENGHWRLRDQQSGNGVFIDGRRVDTASIDSNLTIRLGGDGPLVVMEIESRAAPTPQPAMTPGAAGETMIVAERYFGTTINEDAMGGRTLMIRKAFNRVQKKQKRLYRGIIAAVVLAAIAAGGYAYRGHRHLMEQQALAQDVFYDMKLLDVQIANIERRLATSGDVQGDVVKTYMDQRRKLAADYERFASGLNLYDHTPTPQEQVILRVTRRLGECEMAAPPEYLSEVANYIRKWRSGRYADSLNRAREKGYAKKIVEAFEKQNLPREFFYLAMEESDFVETASSPPTRFGFAKGMWMFIPDTARQYGLKVGPLARYPSPDPADDRHSWEKATRAAAAYIKDLYATDAQASGLLVMASYNWGAGRVIKLLKSMPDNPRERNFWKVLERHRERFPPETYNYVMSIVAAAVIGENPRLFGFGFDNPLVFDDTR